MLKIFALGPSGTYGHEAAVIASKLLASQFGVDFEIVFCSRNVEIFSRVEESDFACGVVPVENATAGLVNEVIKDYWLKRGTTAKTRVIGEIEIPVNHCLLVHKDIGNINEIKAVMSHPQALAQCAVSLDREKIFERIPTASTAGAAEKISIDLALKNTAAIASYFAGELYKLKVLRTHFGDSLGNATRFHVVCKTTEDFSIPTGKDRTAIIFQLPNKPGALISAISCIGNSDVNMSSIHSIPLGISGTYAFYIEFDIHVRTRIGKLVMRGLQLRTKDLLVLGSYPQQVVKGD